MVINAIEMLAFGYEALSHSRVRQEDRTKVPARVFKNQCVLQCQVTFHSRLIHTGPTSILAHVAQICRRGQ